jgi:hypothetical protein
MGISTLPALVRTDLVLVTEEGRIAAEAGGVFGRGDPEHLQQQRLVGALPGATGSGHSVQRKFRPRPRAYHDVGPLHLWVPDQSRDRSVRS